MMRQLLSRRGDALWVVGGQLMAALGTFVGVRVLTEMLEPEVFGGYKLALATVSLVTGFVIRPVLQYAMRAYHDETGHMARARFLSTFRRHLAAYAGTVALCAGALLWSGLGLGVFGRVEVVCMVMLMVMMALTEYERSSAVTRNRQARAGVISVAQSWLIPVGVVVAFALHAGVASALVGNLAVLGLVYVAVRMTDGRGDHASDHATPRRAAPRDAGSYAKEAFAYGWPLAMVGLFSWVVHESDRFFLLHFHSEAAVGIYSAAYGLVAAPFTILVGMTAQFLYPIVFGVASADDVRKQASLHRAMLMFATAVAGVGLLAVWTLSDELAWLALGANYRAEAAPLLAWIALGYGFMGIAMTFDLSAYAAKRTGRLLVGYIAAATVNVALNLLLIPDHGARGAAIATATALLVYLTVMALQHHRQPAQVPINRGEEREEPAV